jgi:hypothetical protein
LKVRELTLAMIKHAEYICAAAIGLVCAKLSILLQQTGDVTIWLKLFKFLT